MGQFVSLADKTVLDVGGGPGYFARSFRAAGARYVGVELDALSDMPAETFAVHDQVTHDKYGLGVILGVEDDIAVLVDFGPQRLRIPVPCAKLTKL